MLVIGVDYHPSFQQVAFLTLDTGECGELQLNHIRLPAVIGHQRILCALIRGAHLRDLSTLTVFANKNFLQVSLCQKTKGSDGATPPIQVRK
jgi:hypothetical protein